MGDLEGTHVSELASDDLEAQRIDTFFTQILPALSDQQWGTSQPIRPPELLETALRVADMMDSAECTARVKLCCVALPPDKTGDTKKLFLGLQILTSERSNSSNTSRSTGSAKSRGVPSARRRGG